MEEGGKRQKYKERRAMRLAGHPPMMRERMPWWYEAAMADFAQREKEQAEAAKKGELSKDPMRPWGVQREKRDYFSSKPPRPGKQRRPVRSIYDEESAAAA